LSASSPRSLWASWRTTRAVRARVTLILILAASALLLRFASGCGETVLVRNGSPIRIAEPVHVYTLERGEWVKSSGRVDVRGWYAVSPEEVE
jgi:hypothetical protein